MPVIYPPVKAARDIEIRKLHSLYYFQLAAGYPLPGERHNFWEMVYMDAGEAEITAGDGTLILRQGEIVFHQPGEYHRIWTNRSSSPNVVVASFTSTSPAMAAFAGACMTTNRDQKRLLSQIIAEGQRLYGPLLDCHRDMARDMLPDAPLGTLQLIVGFLETLLVLLARAQAHRDKPPEAGGAAHTTDEMRAAEITQQLQNHMREHLTDHLTFEDLCRFCGMGGTTLKTLFRRYNGMGVMQCYQQMRVDEARRLLRAGGHNVSEVSEMLGYSSCQYFCMQFKQRTGVSPTQYLKRVR